MATQDYSNHKQYVPLFHLCCSGLLVLTLIGSFVNLYQSWGDHLRLYSASLIAVLTFSVTDPVSLLPRLRLEGAGSGHSCRRESTALCAAGKLLDRSLSVRQTIALRFASDGEVRRIGQARRGRQMTADAIKQAIKSWRADLYRV